MKWWLKYTPVQNYYTPKDIYKNMIFKVTGSGIYERVMNIIPDDFRDKFRDTWKLETGRDFQYTVDYDLWSMALDYIDFLEKENIELKKRCEASDKDFQ
jgi:hypothetical protein